MRFGPRRHALRWAFRISAAILSVFLPLWGFEWRLRASSYGWWRDRIEVLEPPGFAGALTVSDPDVGWRLLPNARWRHTSARGEFRGVEVRTNRLGFRGADPLAPRPEGLLRIAVFGDSFTHAREVPEERTFWRILAERLAADLGRPVEALNFSGAAHSTAQALAAFRRYARPLGPDVALLNFFVGNDPMDNTLSLALRTDDGSLRRPYWVRHPGGGWDIRIWEGSQPALESAGPEPSDPWPWWRRLADGAGLPTARLWLREDGRHSPLGPVFMKLGLLPRLALSEVPLPLHLYRHPQPPEWEEAFEVTRAILDAFRHEAEASGAPLLVGLIPAYWSVEERSWRALLRGYPALAEAGADRDAPGRRVAGILDELGIPHVDATEALRRAEARFSGPLYFRVDRHFTAAGHAAYAETLREAILRAAR